MTFDDSFTDNGYIEDCIHVDTDCEECIREYRSEMLLCLLDRYEPCDYIDEED